LLCEDVLRIGKQTEGLYLKKKKNKKKKEEKKEVSRQKGEIGYCQSYSQSRQSFGTHFERK